MSAVPRMRCSVRHALKRTPGLLRPFQSQACLRHENPLGLPKSGTPPRLDRRLPPKPLPIRDVAKVVAVSSAKGGVGKSTIAANLALAFARQGYRTGILDTDIFGPSIPTLFNLSGEPRLSENNQLVPLTNYGVKTMSMGYLVPAGQAVAWRGLMLGRALNQLLREVAWDGLDVLVLDLPPGTGDTQLSIAQQVVVDGAVVVTTPHTLAVQDAVRGIQLFRKANVPLLGIVRNMDVFCCPHCHGETRVFGDSDAVTAASTDLNVPLLASIPLHPSIGDDAHRGRPTVVAEPDSQRAAVFLQLARDVVAKIGLDARTVSTSSGREPERTH
ncbi:nucleotide-binding protein [Grosmannia clavigera kw1407]|uniref:Nucleotide-binding protein n=1 Tax=Grosmannia clavigera (strain kw1407 / UAMH 11150) TaxID=655863 RepID=F0XBZ7_GROCL|nr:nucleotide-binding protein [Grosmannia clavigera kw1407]EFX04466.1 nucleotide-binding protein [Grosmannia clavigera kw1407]